jgi:choline dehydrogenase-like flavoprotein
MQRVDVPRDGVPVTQAKDVAADPSLGKRFRLRADVVVVGSGAGGSVVAYELAKAGLDVLVLEGGRYYPSSDFTEHLGDTMQLIWRDQAGQVNTTADVVFAEGACVGGSTVIGGCVMHRPPDWIFQRWVDNHGLDGMAPDKLAAYFDQVGVEQQVHVNEAHEINACAHKVIQGCERMGFSWQPVTRNVKRCALTGHCLAGCPSDRKMSALVSHLPWASAYGARMFADTYVTRVRTRSGRASGVDAVVRDPDSGSEVARMTVEAQVVVSAGGAIQTPMLLQRSQTPDRSGQLGKNLAVQPFTQALAEFPEDLHAFRGALVGVQVDEFFDTDGYYFFSGLAEPEQMLAQGYMGAGREHIEFMTKYKRMAALNAFSIDEGNGEVQWEGDADNGAKKIKWNPNRKEFDNVKRTAALAARIFFSAGASRVYLPTYQHLAVDDVFQLDHTLDQVDYGLNGMYTFRMNSFSAQGTCRMGLDKYASVVDPDGESHETKGLFVADGSLFPEPMAAAPQWTVQVVAKHISNRILERRTGLFIQESA